jgi:hypothetical protein
MGNRYINIGKNMEINKLSEVELKALAYDQLLLLQQCQQNIALIEKELKERSKNKEIDHE